MRASSLTENGPVDHPRTPSFETALRAAQPGRSLNLSGPRAGGPVTTVRLGRPLNPTRQPTTRDLVIFIAALVGVPLYALIALAYYLTSDKGNVLLGVLLPAIAGAAVGVLVVSARRIRSIRLTPSGRGERIGFMLIVAAALLGTFSHHLPRWVAAFVDGWAAGFFIAFVFLLVNLWRNNQDFRERIRTIRT
jgi:hypothetical protein